MTTVEDEAFTGGGTAVPPDPWLTDEVDAERDTQHVVQAMEKP